MIATNSTVPGDASDEVVRLFGSIRDPARRACIDDEVSNDAQNPALRTRMSADAGAD